MNLHIEKAKQNENFLNLIESHSTDEFTEWKITVIFYIALHYVKAFTILKKQKSGYSHTDLEICLRDKCKVPQHISEKYKKMYENSRTARYTTYYRSAMQVQLLKYQYAENKELILIIKKYLTDNGL